MPALEIEYRLGPVLTVPLHCTQRPHVTAFLSRDPSSFNLAAVYVLIAGFQACDER
jgi:hypothetical protein